MDKKLFLFIATATLSGSAAFGYENPLLNQLSEDVVKNAAESCRTAAAKSPQLDITCTEDNLADIIKENLAKIKKFDVGPSRFNRFKSTLGTFGSRVSEKAGSLKESVVSGAGTFKEGVVTGAGKVVNGAQFVGSKVVDASKFVGGKVVDGAQFVGNKAMNLGNSAMTGITSMKDSALIAINAKRNVSKIESELKTLPPSEAEKPSITQGIGNKQSMEALVKRRLTCFANRIKDLSNEQKADSAIVNALGNECMGIKQSSPLNAVIENR